MTDVYADFGDFVRKATEGKDPYPYQEAIARRGLPRLLSVPTGSGKTAAAVLPWLWRLLSGGAEGEGTCWRLVYVLPMRALVEQTVEEIRKWLVALELAEQVQVHVLMGGVDRDDDRWQLKPADPAIFVGTQDMILSRALMRGYAEPRSRWPVSFGLLHCGTQWVFDETQLLGPALATGAQLQGLRDLWGTAGPTATMWMSATLDAEDLNTPDHRLPAGSDDLVTLEQADYESPLGVRLRAKRRFQRLELPDDAKRYPAILARQLVTRHVPGTRTIAFLNTVERACAVYSALSKIKDAPEPLLVHSRFRPAERTRLAERLSEAPAARGQIVVATQALEAGVDVSSRVLFTEAAPWSSVVQRAGRCNRAGEHVEGADVLWSPPPKMAAAPYEADDLHESIQALEALEGKAITTSELNALEVKNGKPVHAVLRRRDLLQLFDTSPDLSGADIDVSPWIRDTDDTKVFVAWRTFPGGEPEQNALFPARAELCPAPMGDVRKLIKDERKLWTYDRVEGGWRRAVQADVVCGAVFLADAAAGGYSVELGWAPKSREPVTELGRAATSEPDAIGNDGLSYDSSKWVGLAEHLSDVEHEVDKLLDELRPVLGELEDRFVEAVKLAGRYHDLGKAHPLMQEVLRSTLREGDRDPGEGPWAKSARRRGGRPAGRYPRHELVSALMLLHPDSPLLEDLSEADLVTYLVAAHHGKVRLSVRSLPKEEGSVLGVADGDVIPPVGLPNGAGTLPELKLSLEPLRIGTDQTSRSWTERTLHLRDRPDLGPFRLAFLEALVRIADWRVSKSYRGEDV
ncbi:CRISPR-associated endonuclease Cas3'' [uncultured Thermomonospora sp.]|uniref:type I-G CRISPR-associated helicase/endonuclease Cas3g n=1 Tax=uncultured Thermomonospora sp. TaxID=671175 RepID=UPI00259AF894|nr:CRISPR-associated endonuclease Cas3'' [uncultured Thermomonospora sp.]